MFQGIFIQVGKTCPRISEYNSDKSGVRRRLAQQTGLSVPEVKTHLNAMHAWPRHVWPEHASLAALAWVQELREEILEAYAILERFSPLYQELLQEAKTYKTEKHNLRGSAVSMFREVQERRMIDALSEYLGMCGLPVCGLIHDALLFTSENDGTQNPRALEAEASSFVSQMVGYPVKFSVEPAHSDEPLPPPKEPEIFPDYTLYSEERRIRPIEFSPHDDIRCLAISGPRRAQVLPAALRRALDR